MKTPAAAALLLALAACGGPEGHVSPCGVPVRGDAAGFDEAEARALAALSLVPELAGRDLCQEIGKIESAEVVEADAFEERGALRYGLTWCTVPGVTPSHIKIARGALENRGSLTHEYAHHLLGCGREHDHPRWADRGISEAQLRSAL